jgi:hypothetical protein
MDCFCSSVYLWIGTQNSEPGWGKEPAKGDDESEGDVAGAGRWWGIGPATVVYFCLGDGGSGDGARFMPNAAAVLAINWPCCLCFGFSVTERRDSTLLLVAATGISLFGVDGDLGT